MGVGGRFVRGRGRAFFGKQDDGGFVRRQKSPDLARRIQQAIDIEAERPGRLAGRIVENISLAVGERVDHAIIEIPGRGRDRIRIEMGAQIVDGDQPPAGPQRTRIIAQHRGRRKYVGERAAVDDEIHAGLEPIRQRLAEIAVLARGADIEHVQPVDAEERKERGRTHAAAVGAREHFAYRRPRRRHRARASTPKLRRG